MSETAAHEKQDGIDPRIQELLESAVKVEFPNNPPPLDKNGCPKLSELDEKLLFLPMNDIGNGQRLIRRYGSDLIYIERMGWFAWTGTHWDGEGGERYAEKISHKTAEDMKREYLAMMMRGPREDEADQKRLLDFKKRLAGFRKYINSCGNSSKLAAMRTEARPYLSRRHDEMDTHPLLVNVLNGTIDLTSRKDEEGRTIIDLKPHDRQNLITKIMPVKYDRKAECPNFLNFLESICPDKDVQVFLQRWYGYCLTGLTSEQKIMMKWGGGSNGKGVLMDTMSWIFGEYAKGIPIASLMAKDKSFGGAGASPDLARLPGARFVTASEPETGQKFSENILKVISGEEALTVRELNEKFFEFRPQFKLTISFNNKPSVRSSDDGFWRRVLLVPFEQKFYDPADPARPADGKLKDYAMRDKLKAEGSGILNWLIDGYLMWREGGLQIPEKVRAATDEYRSEANHLLQFFDAWCDFSMQNTISAGRLYDAYVLWAKENGYDPFTKTSFGKKLTDNPKIKRLQRRDANYYQGIDLNADARAAVEGRNHKQGEVVEGDIPV